MKCLDTTGDRKADAFVKIGGTQCDEYGTYLASDGAICTWVAVSKGQKIAIDTGFTGLTKEIQFDLVIDGVLRNSEKTTRKAEKKDRKSEKFEHGFYAQSKTAIIEAEMEIKDLDTNAYPSIEAEGKDSVGTIEVRISVFRDENEERHKLDDVKTFETILGWKEAHRTPSYTKVRPVQEVDFIPIDQQPAKTQLTKLKQRATGYRPGSKPWVVFRFYYRTKEAINNEALTKAQLKQVVKFDAPPIEKTAAESAGAQISSNDPGTTAATSKAGTTTTTARLSSAKADIIATGEVNSTKAGTSTTAAEAPGHEDTIMSEVAETKASELPVTDPMDGIIASADLANTDLGSEQPGLAMEGVSTFWTAINSKCSITKPTEELPLLFKESSTMTTIETQPLATEQQPPAADMVEVAAQALEPEVQQASAAAIEANAEKLPEQPATIDGPKTPQPVTSTAPIAKMMGFDEVVDEHLTPPATPGPVVEDSAVPKPSAIAATVFETSPEVEDESIIESIEFKVEPVEPITPKSTQKLVIESPKTPNSNKRLAFSSTPTPDPVAKRMKLENDTLEKRLADKKKSLAEKRANRIQAQEKANKAQEKARNAEARRKEALEMLLAEIEDEIAEEERLQQEAEEQVEAIEAPMKEDAEEAAAKMEY